MDDILLVDSLTYCGLGVLSWGYFYIKDRDKRKFKRFWDSIGLEKTPPKLREVIKTKYGVCFRFSIPIGKSTDFFQKHKLAIEQYLGFDIRIKYKYKNMLIEVYKKELKKSYDFDLLDTKGLEIPIGYGFGEKLITVDLVEAIHVLIAGETGSGKSTILREIITFIILMRKNIKLHLIDLKGGIEFKMFEPYAENFTNNKEDAKKLLMQIEGKVNKRNKLFYDNDCTDIYEYNNKFKNKQLSHEIVAIDEFSVLRNEKKKNGSVEMIEQLAATARSSGIHLIISTQRPSADIITGLLKANIPCTLGLTTRNSLNSRIIIDEDGLEKLDGKGRGIMKINGKESDFQAMYLEQDKARILLNVEQKKKQKVTKKTQSKAVFIKKPFNSNDKSYKNVTNNITNSKKNNVAGTNGINNNNVIYKIFD